VRSQQEDVAVIRAAGIWQNDQDPILNAVTVGGARVDARLFPRADPVGELRDMLGPAEDVTSPSPAATVVQSLR
jgi:hypothetical protein